jgi:NCS1 family nucleobase:cation symporter-1
MSNLKWVLDKVAVENEAGLSNAQMMLTNSDLRPGETSYIRIEIERG